MKNQSKFDMRRNPVYQINFELQQKGRRVASSKRRAKWSFGFSDLDSLQQGKSGHECRGAEHEVVMIWSLTSGKQRVLADGIEVHFAKAPVGDKFECEWKMNGGHHIQIVSHISQPLLGQKAFNQYDLKIDGLSYWDMPKLYELGNTIAKNPVSPPAPVVRTRSTPTIEGGRSASPRSVVMVPPRRAQSNIEDAKQHVPVADLLSDESISPHSDIFTIPPSLMEQQQLSSPTSIMQDPFSPPLYSTPAKPTLGRAVSYQPCFHESFKNNTPDTTSVCSSSSRSIESAPPAPLQPALDMFINNYDWCTSPPATTPTNQLLSPAPSTPFDVYPSSTTQIVPYSQRQQQQHQAAFVSAVPQTVYATGY